MVSTIDPTVVFLNYSTLTRKKVYFSLGVVPLKVPFCTFMAKQHMLLVVATSDSGFRLRVCVFCKSSPDASCCTYIYYNKRSIPTAGAVRFSLPRFEIKILFIFFIVYCSPTGHQKKLMLAVKKLSDVQKARKNQAEGQAMLQRRRAPPTLELVAIEHHENPDCPSSPLSPKMLTFQDSELSAELQNAMARTGSGGGQDGFCGAGGASMRLSQESIGTRSGGSGRSQERPMASVTPHSRSQESLGSIDSSHSKEQDGSQISPVKITTVLPGSHHASCGSPVPARTPPIIASKAARFVYPPLVNKPRPVVSPSKGSPHGSPLQRGFSYLKHQNTNIGSPALARATLPNGEASRTKKRSQSLSRYALSDGENEDDDISAPTPSANLASYATLTRKPGRSHTAYGERQVARSHSFAIRAKRKGPPPPPPKRLSSAPSGVSTGGVETDSAGSVRSIAARLEHNAGSPGKMSNSQLFKAVSQATPPGNRRKNASESSVNEAENNEALRNHKQTGSQSSSGSSQESIPFAEEGKVTIKQRTKIATSKTEYGVEIPKPAQSIRSPLEVPEFNLKESDTVKRRHKPKELQTKGQSASTHAGNEAAAETEMVSQRMHNGGLTGNSYKPSLSPKPSSPHKPPTPSKPTRHSASGSSGIAICLQP